jgi:acyl-CoA thioesterase YciA
MNQPNPATPCNVSLPERQPTLRVVPMPADVNAAGDIFGGWVMSQVDIAGGVAATLGAGGRVATVAVNAFQFKQPILVGDVVSFYASVARVGRTSITVDVQVYAQRYIESQRDLRVVKVTEATLTYVATHAGGGKREITPAPPAPLTGGG